MRVLTLNVWARSGPYDVREPLLRRELERLAPDVAALQEVDGGDGGDQASELLGPLGYEVAYEPRSGDYRADPGIAVASRQPILARDLVELPHGGAALAVRLDAGGEGFWFVNAVPMRPWPGQEGEREAEVLALDAAVAALADGDTRPPILAGDFDAPPDAASIRFLSGLQSLHGRDWGHLPAEGWGTPGTTRGPSPATARRGSPGRPTTLTWHRSPRRCSPSRCTTGGSTTCSWDRRSGGGRAPRVRSCEVVCRGTADAAPSDHWGVLAHLDLHGVALGDGRGLAAWPDVEASLWGT